MHGNSRTVSSSQTNVHPRLVDEVSRHLGSTWRALMSPHVTAAADAIVDAQAQRPLLLDSGCGDGSSTLALARMYPGHLAVGVDRSAARLGARRDGDEALFLRTDLPRLWQALRAREVRVDRHFLLYPNPSPKPAQRLRRWHFHPAFADLLALGGELELRSNWRVYAEEFAAALAIVGITPVLDAVPEGEALTPFERKYRASAHALWRVRATLTAPRCRS
jgi:tRNA (guanine-N7-)-methyltransferase